MPTLTLSFNLPEEKYELTCALAGTALRRAFDEMDDLLRGRIKYDAWKDARLTRAEEEGTEKLLVMLRSMLNEYKQDALHLLEE